MLSGLRLHSTRTGSVLLLARIHEFQRQSGSLRHLQRRYPEGVSKDTRVRIQNSVPLGVGDTMIARLVQHLYTLFIYRYIMMTYFCLICILGLLFFFGTTRTTKTILLFTARYRNIHSLYTVHSTQYRNKQTVAITRCFNTRLTWLNTP